MKNRFGNPSLTVDTSPGGLFSEIIRTDKKTSRFFGFRKRLVSVYGVGESGEKARRARALPQTDKTACQNRCHNHGYPLAFFYLLHLHCNTKCEKSQHIMRIISGKFDKNHKIMLRIIK